MSSEGRWWLLVVRLCLAPPLASTAWKVVQEPNNQALASASGSMAEEAWNLIESPYRALPLMGGQGISG